jgi:hypothetical protein
MLESSAMAPPTGRENERRQARTDVRSGVIPELNVILAGWRQTRRRRRFGKAINLRLLRLISLPSTAWSSTRSSNNTCV